VTNDDGFIGVLDIMALPTGVEPVFSD